MQKKKLQLAIVGCGAIFTNNHLPALKDASEWQIAFLVDNDLERIGAYAKKIGCGFSANINDIPTGVDACLIATPNFLHAQQSIDLLKKGYHVICEKPMALSLAEAELVQKAASENNRFFFIVHQKRYQQNVAYVKENFINSDQVKDIELSLGNKFGWISRTNFYSSPEKAGGGVFIDLGVHLMDLLLSLWNEIEVNEIIFSASVKTMPVIDSAATCFGTIDGIIPFTLRVSRLTSLNNSLKIGFEDKAVEISLGDSNQLAILETGNNHFKKIDFTIAGQTDPFIGYWQNVASVISGVRPSIKPSMIEDGIKVMKCIETSRNIGQLITI